MPPTFFVMPDVPANPENVGVKVLAFGMEV